MCATVYIYMYKLHRMMPIPAPCKTFQFINHAVSFFIENNPSKYLAVHLFLLPLHPASEEAWGAAKRRAAATEKKI